MSICNCKGLHFLYFFAHVMAIVIVTVFIVTFVYAVNVIVIFTTFTIFVTTYLFSFCSFSFTGGAMSIVYRISKDIIHLSFIYFHAVHYCY